MTKVWVRTLEVTITKTNPRQIKDIFVMSFPTNQTGVQKQVHVGYTNASQQVFLLKDHKYLIKFLAAGVRADQNINYAYGLFSNMNPMKDQSQSMEAYELSLRKYNSAIDSNFYKNNETYITMANALNIFSHFSQITGINMVSRPYQFSGVDVLDKNNYYQQSYINTVSSLISSVVANVNALEEDSFDSMKWTNVYKTQLKQLFSVGSDVVPKKPFVLNDNFYDSAEMDAIQGNYSGECYKVKRENDNYYEILFNFIPCQLKSLISWT